MHGVEVLERQGEEQLHETLVLPGEVVVCARELVEVVHTGMCDENVEED